MAHLESLLKRHFGYSSFRPLQREIIEDALAGKDVFALLPTGGGKSLCFQLPAMARPGLTVVVSPLISLMKDQVDALEASGIPATFLNSTIKGEESRKRLRGLHTGQYRLLYVAPERLMLSGFLEDLQKWRVNMIAVDEAHCISEWGHDFRPEYRQLASLRSLLPDLPIMALTATATERVRADIVTQLKLRDSRVYVASFNRPNLNYKVVSKNSGFEQLFEFVRARRKEAGIVYCSSRKSAESLAQRLQDYNIRALPYHAGLSAGERGTNQDLFLRDEVKVICATIAFGMGINKPNVRFVVHYDLPKNIEGYYQETGRAGRDGLPSECVLFFNPGDVIKQQRFIDEKPDPKEQRIARAQLHQMVHFAEARDCRRVSLLRYFGEEWPAGRCDACDNCMVPRETYDGTIPAQKILSCILRLQQKSGLQFGLNHIVEVLTGADTANIRKWRHHEVTTYGIGKEMARSEWAATARELIRLGFIEQSTGKFTVLSVTDEGLAALRERRAIILTRHAEAEEVENMEGIASGGTRRKRTRSGEIPCDEALFEKLRELRRQLADERNVPAYIIFSDASLRWMANRYPTDDASFGTIPGIGETKLRDFAGPVLKEIRDYLKGNPRQVFGDSLEVSRPEPIRERVKPRIVSTIDQSVELFRAGKSPEEIAQERGLVASTVHTHLSAALEAGADIDINRLLPAKTRGLLEQAFDDATLGTFREIKDKLGETVTWEQIRHYAAYRSHHSRETSRRSIC